MSLLCSRSSGSFSSHWDKKLRPTGPYTVWPPILNSLTSSALLFAPSAPATLATLLHCEHTRYTATGPLHLLFPLPRTLSSRYPHGSLPLVFKSLVKCHLVREVFPDHSLKLQHPSPMMHPPVCFIFLHSTISYILFIFWRPSTRMYVSCRERFLPVALTTVSPGVRYG